MDPIPAPPKLGCPTPPKPKPGRGTWLRTAPNAGLPTPGRPPNPGRKGRVKQHEATNLLLRLRDYKTEVWRFLTDWRVPFDNNPAERMVRPAKVKLKVIGGFRALGGSTAFCILRSVWETNKLNGINPFDTLRLAFEGG